MRRISYLATLILMILGSSCATLSVTEIRNLNRIEFDPIKLNPDIETSDLRIDIVRSTESDTTSSHDLPYRPLGFDLGNGLYYDLNENLSFRLDELLGLSEKDGYEIKRFDRVNKKRPNEIYQYYHDTLFLVDPWSHKKRYEYHRVTNGLKTSVMHRNRLQYFIEMNISTAIYGGKRRAWEVINRVDENHYYLNRNKKRERYELKGNQVFLENDFIIELTDNNRRLNIISQGFLRDRCLYSIERSKDQLYIYDREHRGKKITFNENGITVYHNGSFSNRWVKN
ncbi:MAG: hypothetical protein PHY99_11375 [Bacteroidales bacterium]|nr:hypothetical protein [Bacteroidales bacterium]